jgi:hypothetical protein
VTIRVVEGMLELSGSAGRVLVITREPDTDGEIEVVMEDHNEMRALSAFLGPDERRALVDWLQGIDS